MIRVGVPIVRLASIICLVTVTSVAGCTKPATSTITEDGATGWVPTWQASFTGAANKGIDTQDWRYETGQGVFGGTEIETMTNSIQNVHLDGHGALDITAVHSGSSWTSGRVITQRTFAPPVGGEMLVTASILQPGPANAIGYWPAFWLLGPGTWPEHGEIDVLEDANGLSDHSGTFSCGDRDGTRNPDGSFGPCHELAGLGTGLLPCFDCQRSYKVYSVVIDRRNPSDENIRWYLNGHEFFSVSERNIGARPWTEAVDHGFWIILNLAIGGQYPEGKCGCTAPNDNTTSGGTMSVRDLGVYYK